MLAPEVVEVVALAAAGVAVLALLAVLVLLVRLRSLRRDLAARPAAGQAQAPAAGADRTGPGPGGDDALRHVAVVRYDAFEDAGGRQSFSAALLDGAGDGLVLTAIHGRAESRTYGKAVSGGTSAHTLSPEEQQAIAQARG